MSDTKGDGGSGVIDTDRIAELGAEIMAGTTDLAAIAGMTPDEVEAVYTLGHGYFSSGQYGDAIDIFRFLCMHRHMDQRFWFGLGAACQMSGDHATAVTAYRTCAMLNLEDAQVPLRAAECFIALDDRENAREALQAVAIVAGKFPGQDVYASRARMMLTRLGAEATPA